MLTQFEISGGNDMHKYADFYLSCTFLQENIAPCIEKMLFVDSLE